MLLPRRFVQKQSHMEEEHQNMFILISCYEMQPINVQRQFSKFINSVFSPCSLTELPPFCNLIPSQKWNYKVDGKGRQRTKRLFQSSSQKSEGENLLTEGAFTSTCSLFPQPNMLRWTPKHGLRPEQMLGCLQTPQASEAEGCWLLLGEEFRRAASFLLDLHAHAGWGGREEKKKTGPDKDAFWITCVRLPSAAAS